MEYFISYVNGWVGMNGWGSIVMKKLLFLYLIVILVAFSFFYMMFIRGSETERLEREVGLKGSMDEKYVMVNFLTGIDYWKNVLKGFEDAASLLGVSIEYKGSTQYDVQEQIIVLEQVIARNPAGIAISAMDPTALNEAINKAVDAGIPVVMFDADAPESNAYAYIGTNNYKAGETAAHKMAELLGNQGEVAIITLLNQQNHMERKEGFVSTIVTNYPQMTVVATEDGKGDLWSSEQAAVKLIEQYPKLKGIFVTEANGGIGVGHALMSEGKVDELEVIGFDTDKGTLDMVKSGVLSATIVQGTWNMGYWSLMQLFHLNHELVEPISAQQNTGVSPLPIYIDTGVSVVTKENVEHFYVK